MSESSNKKARTVTEPLSGTAALGTPDRSATKPVHLWAAVGAVFLAYTLYVFIRWVTGPYFEPVSGGPSEPPLYMKIPLMANAIVLWVGLPFALWFFIIRPWVRERRITLDGMLLVSMALMMFQDPMLNYYSTWCTYNAWLFNQGSWAPHIPGWVAHEEPGHTVPEPLLTNIPGYMYGVLLLTIVGCAIMRKIKNRWPAISNLRLILVTYAIAFVFDFVMEALILLPIGFYSYPGAIQALSFNAGTYYQWPVYEGLMWGGVQAALCCLRFFTDDRGRTVVERGLDTVRGGFFRRQFVRFLAIFGVSAHASSSSTTSPRPGWACTAMRGPKMCRSVRTSTPASAARAPTDRARIPICRCRPNTPVTSTTTGSWCYPRGSSYHRSSR